MKYVLGGNALGLSYRYVIVPGLSRLPILLLTLGATTAFAGCSAERKPSKPDPAVLAAAKQEAGIPVEPNYTVDVELPSKALRGQETIARVHVRPKEPWHMNLEYPAKLRLEAPEAISLDTKMLRKTDAERFDDDALVFTVLFTPEAKGPHTIEAQVDFAVCGTGACGPVTEAVQLAVDVSCSQGDRLC